MRSDQGIPAVRAWARLLKAQRLALAAVQRQLKAARLPPLEWYDVLLELERADGEGLRPNALERRLLLAQYNLSRLIERMVRAGHVERRACKDDGRGQLLAITAAGKAMRRIMWRVYQPAMADAFGDRLSASDIRALDRILGGYLEGFRDEQSVRSTNVER